MTSETAHRPAVPRRTWLGMVFAAIAVVSFVACVSALGAGDWLAAGRRSAFGGFFVLYTVGHFRWPHTRWPEHGERAAATLVVGYLGCVALSMID